MTDCIGPQLNFSFYLKQKLLVRFDPAWPRPSRRYGFRPHRELAAATSTPFPYPRPAICLAAAGS